MQHAGYMVDAQVPEALVGRLLHLVGVGVLVEHLLHLPQVHGAGHHIHKAATRTQHPAEFLDGQRGEAVHQQVDAAVRHRQTVGGRHGEVDALFPPGSQPEDGLGDVDTGHVGRFARRAQRLIDTGGVVALAAAVVQHRRGIAGQLHSKLT